MRLRIEGLIGKVVVLFIGVFQAWETFEAERKERDRPSG